MKIDFVVAKEGKQKLVFTEEQKDYIVEQYVKYKISSNKLAKQFGVSYATIIKVLKERKVDIAGGSLNRKYKVDEDFFEIIDTEEKAYWLGFLYADGSVKEGKTDISLSLVEIDVGHIEKFLKSLNSTHLIKETQKKTKDNIYIQKLCYISSKKLYYDLIDKGCTPNKTLILTFPSEEQVPKYLQIHFIRGYIDGDGCITHTTYKGKYSERKHYKISILGTEEFLNSLVKCLDLDIAVKQDGNKKVFAVYIGGNDQVKRITELLYKDAKIYLDRKKDRADELIQYLTDNPWIAWNKGLKLDKTDMVYK